jgi:hypothetical protein
VVGIPGVVVHIPVVEVVKNGMVKVAVDAAEVVVGLDWFEIGHHAEAGIGIDKHQKDGIGMDLTSRCD